jgi:hypothetical protein
MLRDFGRALSEAISDSSEASRKLRQIRDEGYSLYLLLDGSREEADPGVGALVARKGPPSLAASQPEFRINSNDLSFLQSISIDPTQRLQRRRSSP